jgi:hypothetical protein
MARRDRNPEEGSLQFLRNEQWYAVHRSDLLPTLDGQFVAVEDEQVVDSGPYLSALAERIRARRGDTAGVFFGYVGPDLEALETEAERED